MLNIKQRRVKNTQKKCKNNLWAFFNKTEAPVIVTNVSLLYCCY